MSVAPGYTISIRSFDLKVKKRFVKRMLRDFQEELKSLILKEPYQSFPTDTLQIELKSYISPLGKSIKPGYIKEWMEQCLGMNLEINQLKRNELILRGAKVRKD